VTLSRDAQLALDKAQRSVQTGHARPRLTEVAVLPIPVVGVWGTKAMIVIEINIDYGVTVGVVQAQLPAT